MILLYHICHLLSNRDLITDTSSREYWLVGECFQKEFYNSVPKNSKLGLKHVANGGWHHFSNLLDWVILIMIGDWLLVVGAGWPETAGFLAWTSWKIYPWCFICWITPKVWTGVFKLLKSQESKHKCGVSRGRGRTVRWVGPLHLPCGHSSEEAVSSLPLVREQIFYLV